MKKASSINDLIRSVVQSLKEEYSLQEAQQVVFLLLENVLGISKQDQLLNKAIALTTEQDQMIQQAVERLLAHEPIQYVLGRASFYNRDFKVAPGVLIPRPETEELVHWVLQAVFATGARVLDIGTGSGCIPITLALEMKSPKIYALDVNTQALALAQDNAKLHGVAVVFISADILNTIPEAENMDVIICNPPYVPESDRHGLDGRVKDHEPSNAIFVPDENPLIFYKRMAAIAPAMLNQGGMLFMEIYHGYGPQVLALFQESPWSQAQLKKDLQGKDRMVKVVLA